LITPKIVRLAVVLSHPTQYYSPWFRWLEGHKHESEADIGADGFELRVFYLWEFGVTAHRDRQFETTFQWDVDLLSGYAHEFVPNTSVDPGTHRFGGLQNPALTARLSAWRPTAVLLFGYKWFSHIRALWWARRNHVPLLFRGDSHFLGGRKPSTTARILLRVLYAQFDAFLSVGTANRDYFQKLGVPSRKLFFAPHSVDGRLFDRGADRHLSSARALRASLGIPLDTRIVLFAGKFVPWKQPRELLQAFLDLKRANTALVFVGDGPEKDTLHQLAHAAPAGAIHFLPFANQSEMPARYLLADVFALPSRGLYETWGLAVNEAMHMGTPALVSDRVGCQRDLVTDGETGWVFPAEDQPALRAALGRALAAVADPTERAHLRHRAQARISNYTYVQTTAGLAAALHSLVSDR
jgi:glycosyltransferase involved in cell wall biosynthesis